MLLDGFLSNFNTCFFLCGNYITSAYSSFGLIIVVIIFLISSISRKWKAIRTFLSILNVSSNISSICFWSYCFSLILFLHHFLYLFSIFPDFPHKVFFSFVIVDFQSQIKLQTLSENLYLVHHSFVPGPYIPLETRKCRRIERWFAEMDGRLLEQQRKGNSNKRMVQCEKWSSPRISLGPSDVLGLCKWYDRVNSYMSRFTDDAILLRKIDRKEECEQLQKI